MKIVYRSRKHQEHLHYFLANRNVPCGSTREAFQHRRAEVDGSVCARRGRVSEVCRGVVVSSDADLECQCHNIMPDQD